MEEAKVSCLQQESLAFRIQAEEAQRNLAQAHDQLDQIMAETQSQREMADGKDVELQAEDLNGPKETGTRQHKHQVLTGDSKNPRNMCQINQNVDYQ
ncbi:hypothetical protein HF521_014164 [Silurus meridionalis]|uniref:Uncharacterized protein n=1 Tax=Silurus meridionalis TaxID=175797 RepID=A0A8T0AAZ1_SILME|nr:hypothetical protein HF521_014164 [Silurus meridionalis]